MRPAFTSSRKRSRNSRAASTCSGRYFFFFFAALSFSVFRRARFAPFFACSAARFRFGFDAQALLAVLRRLEERLAQARVLRVRNQRAAPQGRKRRLRRPGLLLFLLLRPPLLLFAGLRRVERDPFRLVLFTAPGFSFGSSAGFASFQCVPGGMGSTSRSAPIWPAEVRLGYHQGVSVSPSRTRRCQKCESAAPLAPRAERERHEPQRLPEITRLQVLRAPARNQSASIRGAFESRLDQRRPDQPPLRPGTRLT